MSLKRQKGNNGDILGCYARHSLDEGPTTLITKPEIPCSAIAVKKNIIVPRYKARDIP